MNVWVRLPAPLDAGELLQRARKEGVAFLPGRYFAVARPEPGALRLSFAGLAPEKIREGLAVLGGDSGGAVGGGGNFRSGAGNGLAVSFRFDWRLTCFSFRMSDWTVNVGMAEMLKGGVIMDVTNAEQARIAEDAGASAVMALERVPSDIRKEGGVARMASISKIEEIIRNRVSIPVMAKARIGHFMEARILEALGVDYIDESEVLTPADEEHHINKRDFKVPFVCGARNLGEALRRIAEGATMIRTKGEAGSGNIVEAVRHMRTIVKEMRQLTVLGKEELVHEAKKLQAPLELVEWVAEHGKLPVPNFSRGRNRHARGRRAGDAPGRGGGVRRVGHFQIVRSGSAREGDRARRPRITRIRRSCWRRAANWARPCPGSRSRKMAESELMQTRGW